MYYAQTENLHQPGKGQWDFQPPRRNTAKQQHQTSVHSEQLSAGTREILPQRQRLLARVHLQYHHTIMWCVIRPTTSLRVHTCSTELWHNAEMLRNAGEKITMRNKQRVHQNGTWNWFFRCGFFLKNFMNEKFKNVQEVWKISTCSSHFESMDTKTKINNNVHYCGKTLSLLFYSTIYKISTKQHFHTTQYSSVQTTILFSSTAIFLRLFQWLS